MENVEAEAEAVKLALVRVMGTVALSTVGGESNILILLFNFFSSFIVVLHLPTVGRGASLCLEYVLDLLAPLY
jgi:hypothetical protein